MHLRFVENDLKKVVGSKIQLGEFIALEWKPGVNTLPEVTKTKTEGLDAIEIRTPKQKGWIRLHVSLPREASASVFGIRFVLKLKTGSASVKPLVVETSKKTGRSVEYPSVPGSRHRLKTHQWYSLSGAFVLGEERKEIQTDVTLDLPSGAHILLADISYDWFEAALDANKIDSLKTARAEPVADFSPTEIAGVKTWLMGPEIYGHKAQLSGNKISAKFVAKGNRVHLADDNGSNGHDVALDSVADFSGVSIPNASFEIELDKRLSQFASVVLMPSKETKQLIWKGAPQMVSSSVAPKKADYPRDRQSNDILLWAPISTSGLTVQLEQVTDMLKKLKFPFKISYHIKPSVEHPLCEHWINPRDIDSPKLVIYFERFVEFDRGFDGAFKVFYMNLDWLSEKTLSLAKVHAKIVLCPTPYRLEELQETFLNSQVLHLPWPAKFRPQKTTPQTDENSAIRVLYVGNDYDENTRKHPQAVIEAIERLDRDDLVFDLKFRTPLPRDVLQRLKENPRVDKVIDWSTDHSMVQEMYKRADINLIPNACEGNGLSILESWASGIVPAVLDGHPMKDVISEENSFRIACEQDGFQEYAPYYRTTGDQVYSFLSSVTREQVIKKKLAVEEMADELIRREETLKKLLEYLALLSGVRTKGLRLRVENAHLPAQKCKNWKPRAGERVKDLMFSDEGQKTYLRVPKHVDVLLTTSQRPWCLRDSLEQILKAIRFSPFNHRLFVAIDTLDPGTLSIINAHSSEIDQVLWTKDQHGLPYTWNSLNDLLKNTINRSEIRPDYVCYIQDDCFIREPETYFEKMVGISYDAMPGYLGFVSGYYTEVHPGFADFEWKGNRVIASDSIDGKNFMAPPELMESVGRLTWWFKDGMRRGNPGPKRGSHFDLWQWKESPNSMSEQKRISLVLPDLCSHTAARAEDSTWHNDTTDEAVQKRVDVNRVYNTRKYPEQS